MNSLPGSVLEPVIPGGGFDRFRSDELIAAVEDIAGRTEMQLAERLVSASDEVDAICSGVQASYLGSAGIKLDSIEALCSKLRDKLNQAHTSKMQQVYQHIYNAGFDIPTLDQVHYFKATDDALGSMGLDGTIPTGTTPGVLPSGGSPINTLPATVPSLINPQLIPPPVGIVPPPPVIIPPPVPPPTGTGGIVPPPGQGSGGSDPCSGVGPPDPATGTQIGHTGPNGACYEPYVPGGPWFQPPPGYFCCCDAPPTPPGMKLISTIRDGFAPTFCTFWPEDQPPPPGHTGGNQDCPPGQVPDQTNCVQPADPQDPTIVGGWTNQFDPGSVQQQFGGTIGAPWISPAGGPAGVDLQQVCIDGSHLQPPTTGQMQLNIPINATLYYSPRTGQVFWATVNPGGVYQVMPLIGCDPTQPQINPFAQPCGQNGCVPGPDNQPPPAGNCDAPPPVCLPPVTIKGIPGLDPRDDPCKEIQAFIDAAGQLLPNLTDIIRVQGASPALKNDWMSDIVQLVTGSSGAIIPGILNRFADWLQKLIKSATSGFKCDNAKFTLITLARAGFEFVQKWTGTLPEQLLSQFTYAMNTACQYAIPNPDDADRAYMAGTITEDQWVCYQKAAGNYVDVFRQIRDAGRTRVNPHEVIQLLQREYISDDDASKRLRNLGVVYKDDETDIRNLGTYWPSFQDVIRLMVRDAFDEQAVQDSGFDDEFQDKYTDEAKKYGKAAGIPDRLAQLLWRAHWQMPSYSSLREMLFRLRPDKYPGDMAVTTDVMEKTLKQDDWAPAFVKRMIEIAYRQMTVGDALRGYMLHQYDEDTLKGYILDNGYKPEDADTRVAFYKRQRELNDMRSAGYPTLRMLTRYYANCQIDQSTFEDAVTKWTNSDDQTQNAIEAAEIMRQVTERKAIIINIKREYMLGLIDDATAASELNQAGIDPVCVPGLVRRMKQQKQKGPKRLSASQLCKMRDQNIITEAEQIEALQQVGWTYADAYRIATSCQIDLKVKHDKKSRRKTASHTVKTTAGKATTTDEVVDSETESMQ